MERGYFEKTRIDTNLVLFFFAVLCFKVVVFRA